MKDTIESIFSISVYDDRGRDITSLLSFSPVDEYTIDIVFENTVIGRIENVSCSETEEDEEKIQIEIAEGFSYIREQQTIH